jgi:hypothetical protein
VPVLPRSEDDEIENHDSGTADKTSQFIFVRLRGFSGFLLSPYPVDVFSGKGHAGQERVMSELVITFGSV